jgi:hypothetical protein
MPKITVHGGATNAAAPLEPSPEEAPEWHGNSSSASTENKPTRSEMSDLDNPKLARTTGNRSVKARTARSSARSTGTGGPKADR